MPPLITDEILWRKRAAEARTLADKLTDAETKRTMLCIADAYDHLAQRAEVRIVSPIIDNLLTKLGRTRPPRA